MRVLEGEEEPALGALVRPHVNDALAVHENVAAGDLVGGVAGKRVGERGLARAVRAHDRVHLVRIHFEVDSTDDLGAVLSGDVQVLDLEQSQVRNSLSLGLAWPWTGRS